MCIFWYLIRSWTGVLHKFLVGVKAVSPCYAACFMERVKTFGFVSCSFYIGRRCRWYAVVVIINACACRRGGGGADVVVADNHHTIRCGGSSFGHMVKSR